MFPTEKEVIELQAIFEKKYGKKLTYAEAEESARNLFGLYKALFDVAAKEHQRKLRLKDEPKEFHLTDGTYTCCVCGAYIAGDATWYDRHGIKCMACQQALSKRIIPVEVCKNRDAWYSTHELSSYFNLNPLTARKLVRLGKLKSRTIYDTAGKPYFHIFLIRENSAILPTKPESQITRSNDNSVCIKFPEPQKLPI
jgi:hypothetical protein